MPANARSFRYDRNESQSNMLLTLFFLLVCGAEGAKKYVVELAYSNPKCVGEIYRAEVSPSGLCKVSFNKQGSMHSFCDKNNKVQTEICDENDCTQCRPNPVGDQNVCQNQGGSYGPAKTSSIYICTNNIKGDNFFEDKGYLSSYYYTGNKCDMKELRNLVMRPLNTCIPFAGGATWEKYSCTDKLSYKDSFDKCKEGETPYDHIAHTLGVCKKSLYEEQVLDLCHTNDETPKVAHREPPKDPWDMSEYHETITENHWPGHEDEHAPHDEL